MNSNDLGKAVYARWDAASLDSTVTGSLWLAEANSEVAWPYCVYDIPIYSRAGQYNGESGGSLVRTYQWDAQVQFSVFAKTAGSATSSANAITDAYRETSLTLDDGSVLHFTPQSTVLERLQTDVWQYVLLLRS